MTRHDPREPLDADERELAARLSRLGPLDGPSPALDAKILAAARQAAAPRPARSRRRWLAWASIPPAAITGVGVAAACVLALGVVWQMRPRVAMIPAAESTEEIFVAVDPTAAPPARRDNPPPFEDAAASADAAAAETAAPASQPLARAQGPIQDNAPAPLAAAAEPPRPAAPAPAAAPPAVQAFGADAGVAAEAVAQDQAAPEPTADDGQAADRERADADDTAAAKVVAPRRPTYTSSGRATAERARRVRAAAPPPPPSPGRQEASAFPGSAPPDAAAKVSGELDRVEVTGSRGNAFDPKTLAGLAPSDDSQLDREDWLLRIRARRDAGDLDGARESLRLFRKEYPRVHLPDDLRKLAAETPP